MSDWKPTTTDLAWCESLVAIIKDGGIWGTPATGIYRVDHINKQLVLMERSPEFNKEDYERNVIAFAAIGWQVID